MNVKIHTPKSLKMGSGMSTLKQFVLSLVATTISIVLTFGTAGWLDNRKKEAAKHEMVMMILYDLKGTIDQAERADSTLRAALKHQLAVAADPDLLVQNPFIFTKFMPNFQYTETVEDIFSTNIETINIIGNVLFAENVSRFYQQRRQYKEKVIDDFVQQFSESNGLKTYDELMNMNYPMFVALSGTYLIGMKENFQQCQQMMRVSDAELESYRKQRQEMALSSKSDSIVDALQMELIQNMQLLLDAKKKGLKKETNWHK